MNPLHTFKRVVWLALFLPGCAKDGDDPQGLRQPAEIASARQAVSMGTNGKLAAEDGLSMAASKITRGVVASGPTLDTPPEALVPDTLSGDVDCDSEEAAPSACAWASEADMVAVVTIERLRMDRNNAVAPDAVSGWKQVPNCRRVHPALGIDVSVSRVLAGSGPQRFELRVGARQVVHFRPMPRATTAGIAWTPTQDPSVGPLRVGAQVVVAVHKTGSVWSLMGDVILGVDRDDRIHLPPRTGDCLNTLPQGVSGGEVSELASTLATCDATHRQSASRRRALRAKTWGAEQGPAHFAVADCIDPPAAGAVVTPTGPENEPPETIQTRIP
jgi:hypothetical protein